MRFRSRSLYKALSAYFEEGSAFFALVVRSSRRVCAAVKHELLERLVTDFVASVVCNFHSSLLEVDAIEVCAAD